SLSADDAKAIVDTLVKSDQSQQQIAGLRLASAFELSGYDLSYQNLLASKDAEVVVATIEAIKSRRITAALPALLKMIGGEYEYWAADALGEVGTTEINSQLLARVSDLDKRFEQLSAPSPKSKGRSPKGNPPAVAVIGDPPSPAPGGLAGLLQTGVAGFKALPEMERLALVRGAFSNASEKLKFRQRYEKAKDNAERKAIYEEVLKNDSLHRWALKSLRPDSLVQKISAERITHLSDSPTSGETLFPHDATSYLMAPNLEQTLERLNSALTGIQMETVRDQMVFTWLLKTVKARLGASLDMQSVSNVGQAFGVDLRSPVALATWPRADQVGSGADHNALILSVTDRTRFERTIANYIKVVGDADGFVSGASVLTRLLGIAPAAIPAVLMAAVSPDEAPVPDKLV
ncbi:MAG TPA: hypothetical protein VEF04_09275, partial [Blastocatellia bacterium]|nr:hypothetical protein [Blastocatellia bacterium]